MGKGIWHGACLAMLLFGAVVLAEEIGGSNWSARDAVVRMLDRDPERSLTAIEAAIEAYKVYSGDMGLHERIERNLFPHGYGLRNPDKLERMRLQLVEDYGQDSEQVAAWDAGIAEFREVE